MNYHSCPDNDYTCPYFNSDTGECMSPSGWCEYGEDEPLYYPRLDLIEDGCNDALRQLAESFTNDKLLPIE